MANHVSSAKRARQAEKRRFNNRNRKGAMRTAIKGVLTAVASGDAEAAAEALRKATALIDSAGRRGTIHKNQASRRVSRLSARVKSIAA